MNQVFNLHDPLDSIPLSKTKTKSIFPTDYRNNDLRSIKKIYQNLDPVIRQFESWPNHKSKPVKAEITILGNKTLLRYFREFKNKTINENTDILEKQMHRMHFPNAPI